MSPASNFSATPPSPASPADNPFEVSNATQGQRMRTKRILVNLLSYWYLIALCLIIGVAGSAYYLSKAPKKYSATSTMLIKEQTSAVMGKDQAGSHQTNPTGKFKSCQLTTNGGCVA